MKERSGRREVRKKFILPETVFRSCGLSDFLIVRPGRSDNKKGEGRFSFTFLRREISPATP